MSMWDFELAREDGGREVDERLEGGDVDPDQLVPHLHVIAHFEECLGRAVHAVGNRDLADQEGLRR